MEENEYPLGDMLELIPCSHAMRFWGALHHSFRKKVTWR